MKRILFSLFSLIFVNDVSRCESNALRMLNSLDVGLWRFVIDTCERAGKQIERGIWWCGRRVFNAIEDRQTALVEQSHPQCHVCVCVRTGCEQRPKQRAKATTTRRPKRCSQKGETTTTTWWKPSVHWRCKSTSHWLRSAGQWAEPIDSGRISPLFSRHGQHRVSLL